MDHRLQITTSREERVHQARVKLRIVNRPSMSRGDITWLRARAAPFSEVQPTPSTPIGSMRQHRVCELTRATAQLLRKSAVNCHYQIWVFGEAVLAS